MSYIHLSNDDGSVGPIGHQPLKGFDGLAYVANYRWDTDTLAWVKLSGTTTGIAADVAVTNFPSVYPINDNGGSITVDGTVSISGTVAISAASLPLPTGASTAANQTTINSSIEFGNVFFGSTIRYAALTQASTTDTWTFKTAAAGSTVAVIVITYTDSTKATISNVERTT